MTDEQIKIAIAEACGCKQVEGEECFFDNGSEQIYIENLPDYCEDLNAMHEAENILSELQLEDYAHELCHVTRWHPERNRIAVYRASARQRAEAFLKTIGKWKYQ